MLAGANTAVRSAFTRILKERGVVVHESGGEGVTEVLSGVLKLGKGAAVAFDECLWCTQASAAGWVKETGLPTGAHHEMETAK